MDGWTPSPKWKEGRKEGGRGLVSIKDTIQDETKKIHEYIGKMAPSDELLSEYLRQQNLLEEEREEQEETSWKDKPLHGMSHRQIKESGWYREILPVAGNSWTETQHRLSEADVYHTQMQAVKMCNWDHPAHNSGL